MFLRISTAAGAFCLVVALTGWVAAEEAEQEAPEESSQEPIDQELAEVDLDPDVVLSYDGWFLRFDVGGAYVRGVTRYHLSSDDSVQEKLEPSGPGIAVQVAIGARLGRDVTLGGLGRLVHAPTLRVPGEWVSASQGMYYGVVFIDHRLPAKVLRLGGGVGPGYVYSIGPARESFGEVGPVGTVWLGLDLPTSSRVAWGLVADVTGSAIRNTHDLDDVRYDFSTFMLVVGLSISLRISEPSFPRNMPSLATSSPAGRRAAARRPSSPL